MRNSRITIAALGATILSGLSMPGASLAQEQSTPAPPTDASASRCINVAWIDHTQVLDDQTILFYLKGGEVLRNTLPDKCVGLKISSRGFTYVARNDEVCGNLQTIRVNDTHAVCQLGPFTTEPKKP